MFLQLREAASTIPTIWLNLALVSADMQQYRNAVLLVSKGDDREMASVNFETKQLT
jgi:hypothetical protein